MGFRLVPTSMTMNDLARRNSPHFAFFSSIASQAYHVTVVEDRSIMSVKLLSLISDTIFYFWPKLTHPAAQSLCDS